MSVAQSSGYCNVCQRQTLHQKPKINHVLHLILTLVTLGLWGFVWLTLGLISVSKGQRCATCGTKAGEGAIGPQMAQYAQTMPMQPEPHAGPPAAGIAPPPYAPPPVAHGEASHPSALR